MSVSAWVAGGGSIALVEVTPTVTATNTGVSSLREARAYAAGGRGQGHGAFGVGGVAGIGASVAFSLGRRRGLGHGRRQLGRWRHGRGAHHGE